MKKILVLGGSGLVGSAIIKQMCDRYDVYSTYCHNSKYKRNDKSIKFDVDKPEFITDILNKVKPDIVISCLRGDYGNQLTVHEKAAQYLKNNGGMLYFFSTTNVFDADASRSHNEDDIPKSCTDYGRYKICCEERLKEIMNEKVCILRIPQVWGKTCPRLVNLFKLNEKNGQVEVYPELEINTNTDVMIARQLGFIIENDLKGIFHLAAEDTIKYDVLIRKILKQANLKNISIQNNYEEKGWFTLSSKRINTFPPELRITNERVIRAITNQVD